MYILLIFLFSFFYYGLQEKNDPPKLVWSDEFNYTGAPDSTLWTFDLGNGCPDFCGWGNQELQFYSKEEKNVRVADGKLIIQAHRENIGASAYSSSKVKSAHDGSWKFGYFEIRAQLPAGRGTWPAIWMLPKEKIYGGWPASGEIDIMEHVGFDPGVVHGTVHTTAFNHIKGTQVGKQSLVKDFNTDFHVYAINWTEDLIEFYIDGEKYHEFKNNGRGKDAWPFDQEFYLILNIAVGGGWGGQQGVDETIWPQKMVIDYVRVYEPLYTESQKLSILKE